MPEKYLLQCRNKGRTYWNNYGYRTSVAATLKCIQDLVERFDYSAEEFRILKSQFPFRAIVVMQEGVL